MKEIQITLYEIFGYLVPGFVFASAIGMGYWTLFETNDLVLAKFDFPFWLIIAAVSYLAGHVAQSFANLFLKWHPNSELCFRNGKAGVGDVLIEEAKKLTKEIIDPTYTGRISPGIVIEVCDAMIEHRGSPQTREVYLYREGFYRGMFMALLALAVALGARAFTQKSVFTFQKFTHLFAPAEMGTLAGVALIVSVMFYFRFRRFGKYLIAHKLASALVLRYLDKEKRNPTA